jgi:F-type H+-transporting ATPase subunit a
LFTPTANINLTAGCAITVFLYYQYIGFRRHGMAYIKQFTGPLVAGATDVAHRVDQSHYSPVYPRAAVIANMQGHEIVLIIITLLVPICARYQSCSWGFCELRPGFVFMLLSMIHRWGGRRASTHRR